MVLVVVRVLSDKGVPVRAHRREMEQAMNAFGSIPTLLDAAGKKMGPNVFGKVFPIHVIADAEAAAPDLQSIIAGWRLSELMRYKQLAMCTSSVLVESVAPRE